MYGVCDEGVCVRGRMRSEPHRWWLWGLRWRLDVGNRSELNTSRLHESSAEEPSAGTKDTGARVSRQLWVMERCRRRAYLRKNTTWADCCPSITQVNLRPGLGASYGSLRVSFIDNWKPFYHFASVPSLCTGRNGEQQTIVRLCDETPAVVLQFQVLPLVEHSM